MSKKKEEVKVEEDKKITFELSIEERFRVGDFIPQKSDMLTMLIAAELKELFTLRADELVAIEFKSVKNGDGELLYNWNTEKAKPLIRKYKLSDSQLRVLKEHIKELTSKKEITIDNVKLAQKLENLSVSSEPKDEGK